MRSTIPPPCRLCGQGSAQQHKEDCPAVSPFLSERLIARLSPLRRANLERRLFDHLDDAQNGCNAVGVYVSNGPTEHTSRLTKMLGRACCIITNLNAREARHG